MRSLPPRSIKRAALPSGRPRSAPRRRWRRLSGWWKRPRDRKPRSSGWRTRWPPSLCRWCSPSPSLTFVVWYFVVPDPAFQPGPPEFRFRPGHCLSLRPGPGNAHGGHGRDRAGGGKRHPHQGRRKPGEGLQAHHGGLRQDRHPDQGRTGSDGYPPAPGVSPETVSAGGRFPGGSVGTSPGAGHCGRGPDRRT